MKNSIILAFLAFSMLLVAGCKKDKDEDNNTPKFTCKIDGAVWTPTVIVAQKAFGAVQVGGTTNTEAMQIIFAADTIGTFPLEFDASCNYLVNMKGYFSNGALDTEGFVTVTEYNATEKKVSGTFQWKGYPLEGPEMITVTEGSFSNVTFIEHEF